MDLIEALEQSRRELHEAASDVPEAKAGAKPGDGRWSVLDCVEHVAIVEERFWGRLDAAPRLDSVTIDKRKEADLASRVPDRTARAEAPEAVRPTGRFASLAEALEKFDSARARTIEFARNRGGDVYWLSLEHPRFGPLNGGEYIVLVAGHSRRHAAQIREVKSALGIA
jgi:uncharacterized damage-inducible protein DinB